MSAVPCSIQVDSSRCLACKACIIACATEHSLSKDTVSSVLEDPKPRPRITLLFSGYAASPLTCKHCKKAMCVAACPTGALYYSEEGFVLLKENTCIGCGMCVEACPFGHPVLDEERGIVIKCDGCVERVRKGRLPACVEACPTGALLFGRPQDIVRIKKSMKPVKENLYTQLMDAYAPVGWQKG